MKKLTTKQWVAVGAALLVIAFLFGAGPWLMSLFGLSTNQPIDVETDTMDQTTKLEITDIAVGTGTVAAAGDTVSVHYTGAFTDGRKFDSSYDVGQPLQFQIGSGMLIPGFDQGVVGMKTGGKRRLVIPPDLAYGPQGFGPIPPNATLIFEIELLDVN